MKALSILRKRISETWYGLPIVLKVILFIGGGMWLMNAAITSTYWG